MNPICALKSCNETASFRIRRLDVPDAGVLEVCGKHLQPILAEAHTTGTSVEVL